MAANDNDEGLYPIAVLIDELRNEDVQVDFSFSSDLKGFKSTVSSLEAISRVLFPVRFMIFIHIFFAFQTILLNCKQLNE